MTQHSTAATMPAPNPTDISAIRATILDYYEGWYDADAARMTRALHPSLAKRFWLDDPVRRAEVRTITAGEMIEGTAAGEGRDDAVGDRSVEISILDVTGEIASVLAATRLYFEYLHLVRVPDGWRIINVLWRYQDGHDPSR